MIHIASTFTAEIVNARLTPLIGLFSNQTIRVHYNEVVQQALLPDSEFNSNNDGINVLLIRMIDLFKIKKNKQENLNQLVVAINILQKTMRVPLLIIITPSKTATNKEKTYYKNLEYTLKEAIGSNVHTVFIPSQTTQQSMSDEVVFNEYTEHYGHVPYTLEFYDALALLIARTYSQLIRKPYKVIVLDCDGTLWGGTVEEDGAAQLVIDTPYQAVQGFISHLQKAGFLLCLCSKNSEESVVHVFNSRHDMILTLKQICSYRINWQAKSVNIQSLAQELDLSLDSFIFIDDNPIECAEVQAALPEVFTIHLPPLDAPYSRLDYLKNIWAFDNTFISQEDKNRTEFYQHNKLRHSLKNQCLTYDDFLHALHIQTTIRAATPKDSLRLMQLSQRTNQFNLAPHVICDIELIHLSEQSPDSCLIIEVCDKYGDYGLVGGLAYELGITDLIVNLFFLSCRILGRQIEYTILNYLTDIAKKQHKNNIQFRYKKTAKNTPALGFLAHLAGHEPADQEGYITLAIARLAHIPPISCYAQQKKEVNTAPQHCNDMSYMLAIAKQYAKTSIALQKPRKPRTPSVDAIAASIVELMKKHRIPVTQSTECSFIAQGVDSLLSVMLTGALYQQFAVEIAPCELLKPECTIKKLAHSIANHQRDCAKNSYCTKNKKSFSYLSQAQMQLFEEEQIIGETSRNNMFSAYEFRGDVCSKVLEASFLQLMKRHDSLRYSFSSAADKPILTINPIDSIAFKVTTFKPKNDKERECFIEEFRRTPFCLAKAPLLRVALIENKESTYVLFCIHHLIHDGWSFTILLKELSILYPIYAKKIPLFPLPPVPSYCEYIAWQRRQCDENTLTRQRAFWQKQCAHLSKLDLVYDKPHQEEYQKPHNQRIPFKLSTAISLRLKEIALKNKVTLYHVLSSAFGVFLSHYADQNEVNFITARSGRENPKFVDSIGLFTTLALVRMNIDDSESFAALTKKNKKTIDKLFSNQYLPFNEVMELTGEHVNSKIHAFNQVGFILQSYPINPLIINGQQGMRILACDNAALLYDACDECRFAHLVCFMQDYEGQLQGLFEYNTTLFAKKRIEYMIHAFKTLLKNISEQPPIPARSIPLVAGKQYQLLAEQWPGTKDVKHDNKDLITFFAEQVSQRGNAIAIRHHEEHITYTELDKISNQLAHLLRSKGMSHELPVGIFLKKGINYIIALLAIIKAGGCYLPLELDLPIHRMRSILHDSELIFIISDAEHASYLRAHYPEIHPVLINDIPSSASTAPYAYAAECKQLAYIMYTSGSTGNPKGIAIEQRGIIRLVKSPNYINITPEDIIAQTSSLLFDASTFEIWGALLNGATLVLIDKEVLLDATALDCALKNNKISILFLTTQLAHVYSHIAAHLFHQLRYLVVGGEALSFEAMKHLWAQHYRPQQVINGYGPTENTTFATTYTITKAQDILNPIPIGKPISETQAYVLDKAHNLRPIGAPGTLYLGGTGLARGYLNQEQLNKEKFITYQGMRLYNTGDIVTWGAAGQILYLGRKDNQIKINGHRVELDEVAMQLETHHLVVQALILVKNDHYQRHLVAYVVLEPGTALANLNLAHYLKTILPQYMVPKFYYQMDAMPLTKQGKVDKRALLKTKTKAINYTDYAPPTTTLQEQIVAIYSSILNCSAKEVSIHTDFFALGGNSISALHLIEQLKQQFTLKISFADIYEGSDPQSLSEKIKKLLAAQSLKSAQNPTNRSISPLSEEHLNDKVLKLIKTGNPANPPLVFIHPIGGSGFCYLDLIKRLPESQPCYIIHDPSLDAGYIIFADMQSMAQHYNQLILATIKTNFILAGYSFGGMLSLEMVAQLQRQQADDAVLAVIAFDTWIIADFLDEKAKAALRLNIMNQCTHVMNELKQQRIDPKPWMELYYHRLQDLGFAYKPPQINKKIILFKANEQNNEFAPLRDERNYLSAHTSQEVAVYKIPGNHNSILKPPAVNEMGRMLAQYLKDNVLNGQTE